MSTSRLSQPILSNHRCRFHASGKCSNAPVSPAYDVFSSYAERVPGRFAVLIDDGEMAGDFKVTGFVCSAHTFPMDARSAFSQSVMKTLEQLVENLETINTGLDTEQMRTLGLRGLIRVRGQDLDVDLRAIPGFWSAEMEAEVTMTANAVIDGPEGRLFGGTVSGSGEDRQDAGGACGGGASAMSAAAEDALRNLSREIGERISNAPKLREPTPGSITPPDLAPVS